MGWCIFSPGRKLLPIGITTPKKTIMGKIKTFYFRQELRVFWDGKMAQLVKVFAAMLVNLSSIPRTNMVEGRKPIPESCSLTPTYTQMHKHIHK